jgi:hypothetical protein
LTTKWDITESGNTVVLDASRRGEVTFTVTNRSTTTGRTMLTVEPADGAREAWFTVDEPQRAVPAGASVVFSVVVTVPVDVAVGDYGFQGVAYDADGDPAESSASSKRVSIPVTDGGPPQRRRKWPLFLAVAIAVALVVGVGAWLATRGNGSPPPDAVELRNEVAPEIEGAAVAGSPTAASPGQWTTDVETTFQWMRCDASGSGCASIEGVTTDSFTPRDSDVGFSLRVGVTAVSGHDTATAESGAVVVLPSSPVVELTLTTDVQVTGTESKSVSAPANAASGEYWRVNSWEDCQNKSVTHTIGPDPGGWAIEPSSVQLHVPRELHRSSATLVSVSSTSIVVRAETGANCFLGISNGSGDISYYVTYTQLRPTASRSSETRSLISAEDPLRWGDERTLPVTPGQWSVRARLWDGTVFTSSVGDDRNPYLKVVDNRETVTIQAPSREDLGSTIPTA